MLCIVVTLLVYVWNMIQYRPIIIGSKSIIKLAPKILFYLKWLNERKGLHQNV